MARTVGRDRGVGGGVRDRRVPGVGWFGWNATGLSGTWQWQEAKAGRLTNQNRDGLCCPQRPNPTRK